MPWPSPSTRTLQPHALLAVILCLIPAGAIAHDEADLLYSNQLSFGAGGEPIVTVGLMEEQVRVQLTSSAGLVVRLSGPANTQITLPPGAQLSAEVENGKPGESRYRVVLEEQRGGDLTGIRGAISRWKKVGVAAEPLEIGGIVGFPSRLLDNRRALIVEEGFHAERALAQRRADALANRLPLENEPRVFADSVRRARGKVIAIEPRTGTRIVQDDLLTVQAVDGGPITVRQVEFGRGYAHHGFEDRRYHGEIILVVDPTAKLTVVNRLPAELMLQGIVPSETFPTAPDAALDAQAITARTELLAKLGVQNRAYPYLICATQRCQVYGGLNKETPMTNRAVQRTRGMMLFGQGKHLVDSVYHACSGGYMEANEDVWAGSPNPALRAHLDAPPGSRQPWPPGTVPSDEALRRFLNEPPPVYMASIRFANKVFRWQIDIDDDRMSTLVQARHPIGRVRAVQVMDRGSGGRVKTVRFLGSNDSVDVHGELAVRRLLGNLRSGLFLVDRLADGWRFTGGGYGHGVGMSQYGAIGMAERGASAEKILGHYYRGGQVSTLY